ncbi:MAG: hypothetical protein OEW84_08365 [Aigarchaeota archaeon]|nr:hypothetical protein [Aigarchaeota archaeon]
MRSEGFTSNICAAYEGYSQCDQTTKGRIPDAMGYDADRELWAYGEVKTSNDIDNKNTKEQFADFSGYCMEKSRKLVPFHIVIPKGSEDTLRKVLKDLNLDTKPNVHWKAF